MRPATEVELAEAIRGADGPLNVVGGGTRGLAAKGEPLETAGLAGITLYEPGALTMVARAGTPLAEIEAALAAEGQMLAFEPGDLIGVTRATGRSTIGGVFATNASGPRRVQAGAARDFLLGVRFVDGSGNIVKNGGRVMKNVTGYDLVKLLAGSYGTLGVLTEVSFKVLPRPDARASLVIRGPQGAEAVAIMSRALGSPFEVSGAAHVPAAEGRTAETILRVEGFADSVAYRLARLRDLVAPMVARGEGHDIAEMTDAQAVGELWDDIRDLRRVQSPDLDLWRIATKPSDAPAVAARLPAACRYLLDWGGGRIWAFCKAGTDLRAALGPIPGHATLVHAPSGTTVPRFHPEPPAIARLTAGLRARFDPRGILNAGIMG